MEEVKGSNQSLVKITNQMLIVNEIRKSGKDMRQSGQLSRSDLAKRLKLSNPSISKNVDDLISKGLLIETGSVITEVGRRPIVLQFNGKHGCVAVIDLSSDDGRICIADLLGNKIKYSRIECGRIITERAVHGIIATLSAMMEDMADRCGSLVGICIGAPGLVDSKTGRIKWSARIENYHELDLRAMFGERFNVPVIVKNDVNLAVRGERIFGVGNSSANMAYVNIDVGVGLGIILGGKLFEGPRGFAGDFGVFLTDAEKMLEIQNTRDQMKYMLENRISIPCIVDSVKEMYNSGRQTIISTFVSDCDEITFGDVVKAYGMGDNAVTKIIEKYARLTAYALKNIASLFDFELIVIGGQITKLGSSFTNLVVNNFLLFPGYVKSEIKITKLLDTAVIFGGIDTATQYAIEKIIAKDYSEPQV